MFAVEMYAAVRRFVITEGHSKREAARVFGLSRTSIDKMCAFSVPSGYRRKQRPARPKLDPFVAVIDAILDTDRHVPKKQRHTAMRIPASARTCLRTSAG